MIKKISFLLLFVFAAFAAKAQTIDLVAPNGGENYATNSNQFIVWTSSGISNVKIEFSADGGTSWSLVSASVATAPGVGFYSWAVPAAPSAACRVRISDVASPAITDISVANFSISSPTITLTSPNGGETIGVGSNYNITWTGVGVSTVKLEYTVNNGSTWNPIINSVSAGSGSYTWAGVPNNPSSQCKIRITDISNPLVSDQSNNIFTIVVPSLVVTTPNGGETLTGATTSQIYWNSTGVSGTVTLKYTTDGITWNTITGFATNNGTYNWSVPNNTTACAKVAIIDNSNPLVADTSNACFAINASPGTVTIFSPNGGESWGVGSSRQITWSSSFITNVKIEYSTDNGATWTVITASVSAGSGSYSWNPIPNTISSNCKVRVSDATNPAFFDVSNVIFSIVNPLATVTYPNGGESFVGNTSTTVYWSSLGLGTSVDLFYSIDGGSSWTQFGFSTPNDGNQFWSIPNLPSTTCKIRVRDTSFPNSEDVSDANFTITAPIPTITLTTPNGGENWSVGSSRNIFWTSSNISQVNIDYSIDNGATWTSIATNISAAGGFYNWSSVANAPSCIAKIRVTDASNALYFDASNNNFCITTPSVTVTTPNGGQTYTANSSTTIFWNSAGLSNNVNVYYSTDGGTLWNQFLFCTANDGNQNWNIPATVGNQYRIKVEDCSSPFTFDISDANFTVVAPIPTITVSSPNGGDVYGISSNETISWTGTNLSNGVNLEYSLNNGSTWTTISTFTSGANSGNYTWLVPNVTPSTSCLVRVTSLLNGTVADVSNSNFSIVSPTLTLIDPNGGQSLVAGSSYTVRYNTLGLTGNIKLELSTDGGVSYPTLITNFASGTSYNWTVNNLPSTTCRIRATSTTITTITDISDANFTILAPTPTITQSTPNGGEFYTIGSTQTVSWFGSNLSAGVNLEYSLNSGTTWTTITTFTSGAGGGSYSWLIPTVTPSTTCLFRVSSLANPAISDVSNAVFTISNPIPSITVTAPNTNVFWGVGTAQTITWNCSNLGAGNLVNILMSYDNGSTWTTLASSYTSGATSGSYNLTSVAGPVSASCLIRVENTANTTYFDQSNVLFNVVNRQINVSAPNGGEVVYIGSFPTFSWSSLGVLANVRILLSRDGGATYPTTITNAVAVNSTNGIVSSNYGSWQAVAPASTQCRIRVVDVTNATIVDESNADFTIAVPVPTVTVSSPNGGEVYGVGGNTTISWNCSNLSTSNLVNIEYSTDNGISWISIVSSHTSFASSGSYIWTNIPNTPSTNCKVRVSDVAFPSSNDVSNNTFTIVTPYVYVASPNGGEAYTALTNNSINWSSAGFTGNVDLAYKTTLGAAWTNIATNVSNTGSYNWSVPNTPTTTAKVRVRSTSFFANADSSDAFFTINPAIKTITVTTPNGGEIYGVGTNKTIFWTASNVATVRIELSLDNGATYPTTLTASTSAAAGSFSWNNIANTPSNLCKIKITDISDATVSDVSNNTFTIVNPTLTISAPNGGETFVANSNYNISWFSQGASNNYRIEVSTDGGTTYQMINANYFTTQQVVNYSWFVNPGLTGLPSTNCLVRVTDISGIAGAPLDVSDNTFTINLPPPSMTVTAPNGGQNWVVGSNQNISWSASFVSNLKIEYTTDNGLTWNLISASVPATNGSILWTVPNAPSSLCRVRISDAANPTTYFDLSNNVFNIISPSITLVTPNCGELWNGASNYSIFWSGTGLSGTVKLEYSINNGSTWNSITNFAGSSSTGGSYNWNVPNTPSTLALVRVTDNGTPTLVDVSNCNFTILSPNPYITVNYPNGGEQFGTNNNVNITWQSAYVSNVNIEYYNGSTWQSVATNISAAAGSYAWTTPGVANGAARIRIIDAANGTVSDQSNGIFTIVSPSVTVTSPNGFENLIAGNNHNITWNSIGLSNYVRIRLSTNGGTSYTVISNSEYNDGLMPWSVPNTPSTQCRIEISDYNNALVVDASNSNFTISAAPASITLNSPNGGQIYATGSTQNITWSSLSVANIKLELSTDGGSNYSTIVASYPAATGVYTWTVPSTASTNCLVRISDASNALVNDISNSVFEIAAPYITVTAPNGGNNLMVGNNYYITWASLGVPNVKVEFSTNGGTTWTALAANTANVGYFYWNVPNQITTTAKIRVSSLANAAITDASDANFSIINSTPSISLSSPNGGQYWYAGSSYYINWTSSGVSNVKLEYTVNNGTSWTDIVTSYPAISGYYYWNVPITPSTQCKVRVSNAANPSLKDESNAVFTISSPTPYVQVNYPNGSEIFNIGSFENIAWTKNNINAVKVEISRNGGGSWTTLVTSTTANSYYWNVTAPNSTNCLIRVTDANDANQFDISNGPFTINTTAVNTNTITTSAIATPICKGATIDVSFTQNGTFNVGNVYTAQLSDAFGSFANPILIGSFSGITPSTMQCVIPTSIANGTAYRIRVVASNLPTTGANNGTDLIIQSPEFDFTVGAGQQLKYLPDGQVDFTYVGTTSDIISYTWTFGSGDVSMLQNPTYSYTQIGFYDISLTAINTYNCVTTLTKPTYIRVERLFTNTLLNTGTTSRITGASFINPDKGCFALENGNCIVTADSGATFSTSVTGATVGLTGASLKNGKWYVSGQSGTLLKSTDQGASWAPIASAATGDLKSISFAQPDTGFVVGANGVAMRVENGTAVPQTTGVSANLTGVSAIFDEAYAVGENGTIVHFDGSSWSTMPSPTGDNFTSILMYEFKATKGYACDEGGSIIRFEGGQWEVSLTGVDVEFKSIAGYQNDSAWVSATEGIIYVTYDGGDTWGRYSVGSTTDMNTIVFTEGRGFVAGNDGEARRFLGDAASDGSNSNGGNPPSGGTCTTPTAINVNGITDDQAVLNWTNGSSESSWDVEYGVSPYTFTGTPTTTSNANQLTLTGLSSFTTYECKVRSNCGATNSTWSAVTTFTTSTTNIDELASSMKQFITYPVPSNNELNIETKFTTPTNFKIVLKDIKGVEVNELFNGTASGNYKQTVDVSTLKSGIYFLHVTEGSKSYVRRIVVSQ